MKHFSLATIVRAFVIAIVTALVAPSPAIGAEQFIKPAPQFKQVQSTGFAQLLELPKAAVSYSGVRKTGAKLTAHVTGWSDSDVAISYQWFRGNKKIKNATGPTYKQVKADNKKSLRVRVTGTKPGYKTERITSVIPKAKNGKTCTIIGSPGDDTLRGTSNSDIICGFGGDDIIIGGSGNDTIDGGAGDDEISGGKGNDNINGGDNDDYIDGENGKDNIIGGDGDDGLVGGPGNDSLNGDGGTPGDVERNVCHDDGSQIVYCGYDESAPEISEITVDRTNLDTSAGDQTVTFTFRVTDDLLGTARPRCTATHVDKGGKQVTAWGNLISGHDRDGRYNCTLTFPRWSTPGDWYVGFNTQDWAYSYRAYMAVDENSLASCVGQYVSPDCEKTLIDGPGIVKVSGDTDSTAPELKSLTFSKKSISTTDENQTIRLRAHISDDLSGMGLFWNCNIENASGPGVVRCGRTWSLVEGTIQDGVWETDVIAQKGLNPGTYTLSVSLRDRVGNIQHYWAYGLDSLRYTRNDVQQSITADSGFEQIGALSPGKFAISNIKLSATTASTSSQPVMIKIKLTPASDSLPIINNGCFAYEPISKTQIWGGPGTEDDWLADVCHIEFPRGARRGTYLISVWGYGEVLKYADFDSNAEGTGFINVNDSKQFISTPSKVTVE